MSHSARLRRLERQAGESGRCAVCGGRGGHCIVLSECRAGAAEPVELSRSGGCPGCGEVASIKQIILDARPGTEAES